MKPDQNHKLPKGNRALVNENHFQDVYKTATAPHFEYWHREDAANKVLSVDRIRHIIGLVYITDKQFLISPSLHFLLA